jgi:hypothetical protein
MKPFSHLHRLLFVRVRGGKGQARAVRDISFPLTFSIHSFHHVISIRFFMARGIHAIGNCYMMAPVSQ